MDRPAIEPRRRGAAGEPDGPVGVRRGAHGERRPRRRQPAAAEEGRRPQPAPGEGRDGGGGGRGGGDQRHGANAGCCSCVVRLVTASVAREFKGSRSARTGVRWLIRDQIARGWPRATRRGESSRLALAWRAGRLAVT
jgi:hypothetical protein